MIDLLILPGNIVIIICILEPRKGSLLANYPLRPLLPLLPNYRHILSLFLLILQILVNVSTERCILRVKIVFIPPIRLLDKAGFELRTYHRLQRCVQAVVVQFDDFLILLGSVLLQPILPFPLLLLFLDRSAGANSLHQQVNEESSVDDEVDQKKKRYHHHHH